jgi:hypothetical protein
MRTDGDMTLPSAELLLDAPSIGHPGVDPKEEPPADG